MDIVMIGAGNLATHLSKALHDAGFNIIQVYSRSKASAGELATSLGTTYTTDLADVKRGASLYIISVHDDAIASVAEQLVLTDELVVHTAGSISLDVLSDKFQNSGVIYPLQTFSKYCAVNFKDIPVFMEADSGVNMSRLQYIVEKISDKVLEASSAERMYIHLAGVFGCNFVNYFYDISSQIANQTGFNFDVLSPLIFETARKAAVSGNPREVQTGPAVRNDCKIIAKHIDLLKDQTELQNLYALLSECIYRRHK